MNVSFVCTLCNRFTALLKMCDSLLSVMDKDDELIVADFASTDILAGVLKDARIRWLPLDRPFRNCYGNNQGANAATKDAVCFVHADMDYPDDFRSLLVEALEVGGAWFPIFKDIDSRGVEDEGIRPQAFGICAFRREDVPAWDESVDGTWGEEDRLLHAGCKASGMKVSRSLVPGLLHRWHPTERSWLEQYM